MLRCVLIGVLLTALLASCQAPSASGVRGPVLAGSQLVWGDDDLMDSGGIDGAQLDMRFADESALELVFHYDATVNADEVIMKLTTPAGVRVRFGDRGRGRPSNATAETLGLGGASRLTSTLNCTLDRAAMTVEVADAATPPNSVQLPLWDVDAPSRGVYAVSRPAGAAPGTHVERITLVLDGVALEFSLHRGE